MPVNYGALSLPNFNALILQGFQTGREMKRQDGENNALAKLVTQRPGYGTPGIGDDVESQRRGALEELAVYNPQMAYQMSQQEAQRQAEQQKKQQAQLEQGKKAVGQAALQIAQLPEGERPQAWDQAIDYLVQQGWDGLAQYKGKYNQQSLMGVISEAGLANELRTATQPRIVPVQPGGYVAEIGQDGQARYIVAPEGQAPQPTGMPAGSPLQGAANSKVVGDRQYWNIGGKWYDNPEGR